jgi:DNA-binding SARP family transcriptional activator
MRFSILGPLSAEADDGSPVVLTRPSQRATLAVLLLLATAGPASGGQLAEAIWGHNLPAGAGSALRVRLTEVRRALADPARLQTRPAGYQLAVRPGELDAGEFRALTSRGRVALDGGDVAVAAGLLAAACSLWREPPLADVPDTEPCRPAAAGLLALRRDAGEWLVDARLGLGHHHELVSALRADVAGGSLSEHQHVQLMLALYRCGQKSAALEAYSRLRELMAREYGIDPGPEAQQMLRRVLADSEDLQFMPAPVSRGA